MTGLGVDIIEIDRIEEAVKKSDKFLVRIFTDLERQYIEKKGSKSETIAGLFAAKEAVAKVLGTGISGFSWHDIEVSHSDQGQPLVSLHQGARKRADELGINRVHLSIAHCKTYAVANAMGD